ncbi:MAG: hypothetical protein JWO03_1330 [Bacteroidetes bacterium]|nr:hypothetical protein [Bacteroidota bacterium]
MDTPNDVALYSNLCQKSLLRAKDFFETHLQEIKKDRQDHFIGSKEETSEFYNYFEDIISAIIFAYTSIEALANICIPSNYKYIKEGGDSGKKTIYSKKAIEREFTLRDKLKNVLSEVLYTENVAQEQWWPLFIDLENYRNEIIHTKQVESEERYSKLLSKKVFEIIQVYKLIIEYYGKHIADYRPGLLTEFPYGFGHDSIYPSLTSEEGYKDWIKTLYNPSSF